MHHTTDLLPADVARRGPIAVTSALRTAIDLAGVVAADVLEVAIESRVAEKAVLGGPAPMARRSAHGYRSIGIRSACAISFRGETSAGLRARLGGENRPSPRHRGFRGTDAAVPVRHHGKEIARVDLAYPDAPVHPRVRQRPVARRDDAPPSRRRPPNRLGALGWTVVEVTPETLRQPAELVAIVLRCSRLRWGDPRGGTRGGGALVTHAAVDRLAHR